MNWLRKFKQSAAFGEIILIIIAVIAIFGLAAFVHLRGEAKVVSVEETPAISPNTPEKAGELSYTEPDPATQNQDDIPGEAGTSPTVEGAYTNEPLAEQMARGIPEENPLAPVLPEEAKDDKGLAKRVVTPVTKTVCKGYRLLNDTVTNILKGSDKQEINCPTN